MERSLFVFNSLKLRVARSPLRSPAFLRLWLGLSISYVGDQFTTIALLWFVLQLTGSGVALSLVLLCFQLPSMLTGPLLGTVLDRWQPRVVMGIDNCTRALLIGAIPVLSWVGVLQLWQIYALASTSLQFASLLGPALAGILVAEVGGAFALLIDAMSFLLMGFLVFSLPPIARHTFNEASPVKQTWLSGFDLLVRIKEIRLLTSLSVLFFFSYGPLEAAL